MSAKEIIEQIRGLSATERAEVTTYIVENSDSWIPDDFKQAMDDADKGRTMDMETVLREAPPPRLQ